MEITALAVLHFAQASDELGRMLGG